MKVTNLKKAVVTFPLQTGKKKRLITTYRDTDEGRQLRSKHLDDLKMLEAKYPLDTDYAFAYLKNQSIKMLVTKHLKNQYFYQFDLRDFFGSIDHSVLKKKLNQLTLAEQEQLIFEASNNHKRGLVLGLVISPYLSNIYMQEFDQNLAKQLFSQDPNIVYTRYSDDITISANRKIDINRLIELIQTLLKAVSMELNDKKTVETHLQKKGQHLKVLGLNIICGEISNYITVGRKFKANTHRENSYPRQQAMRSYINYNEL